MREEGREMLGMVKAKSHTARFQQGSYCERYILTLVRFSPSLCTSLWGPLHSLWPLKYTNKLTSEVFRMCTSMHVVMCASSSRKC